jgi:hypothetical protein
VAARLNLIARLAAASCRQLPDYMLEFIDSLRMRREVEHGRAPKVRPEDEVAVTRDFEDGSDGSRTRDLRRDRPVWRLRAERG